MDLMVVNLLESAHIVILKSLLVILAIDKCLVVDRLEINLGVKLVDLILIDEILV